MSKPFEIENTEVSLVATMSSEKMLHLVSQEGEVFDVPISVAKMSELVKTMIDGK